MVIINRSIEETTQYLEPYKNSCLSEKEFETFVRKFFSLLREKITFWRLLSQLLLQKDVREQFLKSKTGPVNTTQVRYTNKSNTFLLLLNKMIADYFTRKKEKHSELLISSRKNMFIILSGFSMDNHNQD